jgi:hypothetical protein
MILSIVKLSWTLLVLALTLGAGTSAQVAAALSVWSSRPVAEGPEERVAGDAIQAAAPVPSRGVDLQRHEFEVVGVDARLHVAGVIDRHSDGYGAAVDLPRRTVSEHAAAEPIGDGPVASRLHGAAPNPAFALLDHRHEARQAAHGVAS